MSGLKRTILWSLALLLTAGCAATAPPAGQRDSAPSTPPPVEEPIPAIPAEDRTLFYEGIFHLSRPGKPETAEARRAFASFIQRYPQSPLRATADSFVRLIDEGESLRETGRQSSLLAEKLQAEKTRLQQENEQLKKTVRDLSERLKTAPAALSQENEQLRKDLRRLKELEIELEKRDRMLR